MEFSLLFIPLSLSLSLSPSVSLLDTLHYPCEDNSFFLFSSILNHLIALLLRFTGSLSIALPKKLSLIKIIDSLTPLKTISQKKEQNSPELTSRGSNSSGWGHRLGPDQNGCPELVNCYETRTGTSKWFGNSNDWNHCCATVCLPWQTILSGFFFRECTLIFMIERKRPGHSDNVGLSEEDSSSFDHQIRWVLSNIRYIPGLCHWKIRA